MGDQPKQSWRKRRRDKRQDRRENREWHRLFAMAEQARRNGICGVAAPLRKRIAEIEAENREYRESYNAMVLIPKLRQQTDTIKRLQEFVRNGIEFGYIQRPEPGDPANETIDAVFKEKT